MRLGPGAGHQLGLGLGNIEGCPLELGLEPDEGYDKPDGLEDGEPEVASLHGRDPGDGPGPGRDRGGEEGEEERHLVDEELGHRPDAPDGGKDVPGEPSHEEEGYRREGEEVEDEDQVTLEGEGGGAEDRHVEKCGHDGGEGKDRCGVEGRAVHSPRVDDLLPEDLDEVGEGLEERRADPVLHPGRDLPVQVCQKEGVHGEEEEPGEDQDVEEKEKGIHQASPPFQPSAGPLPVPSTTVIREVQERQGSMAATITGMSAMFWFTRDIATDVQLARVGVRISSRSTRSVPFVRMKWASSPLGASYRERISPVGAFFGASTPRGPSGRCSRQ